MSGGNQGLVLALVAAVTVLALGGLTAGIGSLIQGGASTVEAERAADELGAAVDPKEIVGTRERSVDLRGGTVDVKAHRIRIVDADGLAIHESEATVPIVEELQSDALVYTRDDQTIRLRGRAITTSIDGDHSLHREPGIITDDDTVVLGIGLLQTDDEKLEDRSAAVTVIAESEHERVTYPEQAYAIAIETPHPDIWEPYLESTGASVETTGAQFPDDDYHSVIATFAGERELVLVRNDVTVEVQA